MTMSHPIASQIKSLCRLTLEDISLRRVALLLIRDPASHMYEAITDYGRSKVVKPSGNELKECDFFELGLPESMRGRLVDTVNIILLEAYKWLMLHVEFLKMDRSIDNCPQFTRHIQWTQMGTVNYRETAQAIIRDEKWNIDRRFQLACLYCLEEDIRDLWKKLSPLDKKRFYNNGQFCTSGQMPEIVIFWTLFINGRLNILIKCIRRHGIDTSIYQYAFETFAGQGYETAAQYFFEKLTCEEKNASLMKTVTALASKRPSLCETYKHVSVYLLYQMNAEQFQNVLENSPLEILRNFLDWPRQEDACLEIAKLIFPYFKDDDYEKMSVFLTLTFEYRYNSAKLFRDLYLIAPKEFRQPYYLFYFSKTGNAEMIKFMFRNMDPVDTSKIIYNVITLYSCYKLVVERKWDFLEFFIRELRLSNEDRKGFTDAFCSTFQGKRNIGKLFTKFVNDISAFSPNRNSNCSEINQMDRMDFQPSGQPDV